MHLERPNQWILCFLSTVMELFDIRLERPNQWTLQMMDPPLRSSGLGALRYAI